MEKKKKKLLKCTFPGHWGGMPLVPRITLKGDYSLFTPKISYFYIYLFILKNYIIRCYVKGTKDKRYHPSDKKILHPTVYTSHSNTTTLP